MVKCPGADRTGKRRSRKSTANVSARTEQREEAKAFFRTYAERVVFACTGVAKDPASIAPKAEKLIELLCGGDEPIVPRER